MATKYNLIDAYVSEMAEYNRLYLLGAGRTSTGNPSFKSTSSNVLYTVSNNTGENGLLVLLQNALASYLITASDWNTLNSDAVATTATANKILKLNGSAKLPASITGDAATVGGFTGTDILSIKKTLLKIGIMAEMEFYNHDNVVIDSLDDTSGLSSYTGWTHNETAETLTTSFAEVDIISNATQIGSNLGTNNNGITRWGQTFTPTINCIATSASISIQKYSNNFIGTIYYKLYATSGGFPTGSPIASGSLLTSTDINYHQLVNIVFTTPVALIAGATYALVFYGDVQYSESIFHFGYNDTGSYSGGNLITSTNSGSSWTATSGADVVCTIYGKPYTEVITTVDITLGTSANEILFTCLSTLSTNVTLSYRGSLNGGSNWTILTLDEITTLVTAGTTLKLEITATWTGTSSPSPSAIIYGWGASVG